VSQSPGLRFVDASDRSLLIVLGDEITLAAHQDVVRLTPLLRAAPSVINVHPAYASILVDFDPLAVTHGDLERAAVELDTRPAVLVPEPRMVEIPVRYGGEDGPDLEDVAALNGLTPEQVVGIHAGAEYLVYFLGFSPGFPYLGGMPESIATPRPAGACRRAVWRSAASRQAFIRWPRRAAGASSAARRWLCFSRTAIRRFCCAWAIM